MNRVARLRNPPAAACPNPKRLVHTATYAFARVPPTSGTCAEGRDAPKTNVRGFPGRRSPRSAVPRYSGRGVRVVRKHGKSACVPAKCDRTAFDREVDASGESRSVKTTGDDTLGDGSTRDGASGRFRKSGGVKPAPKTPKETVLKPARQQAGGPRAGEAPSVTTGRTSHRSLRAALLILSPFLPVSCVR